jgi:hypothetical protein
MIDDSQAKSEQPNVAVGDASSSGSVSGQTETQSLQNSVSIEPGKAVPRRVVSKKKGVEDVVSDDASAFLSDEDKEFLSDLTKTKSSSERSKIKREREAFLSMLGLDPKELMPDFTRLCSMALNPSFALTGADPMDRIQRMEMWVKERRKVMPRAGSTPLLKNNINGQFSIGSERAEDAFNDIEEVTRLIFLSRSIASRLEVMAADQRAFEVDLMDRLVVLQSQEDKVQGSLPSWIIEIARLIEATGLQASSFRGHRREMVDAVIEVVKRSALKLPDEVNKTLETGGVFDRVTTRIRDRAESDDLALQGEYFDSDVHSMPQISANDDDDVVITSQQNNEILAPAIDEKSLRIGRIKDPALRAEGHGMIYSIDNVEEAFQGYISQFVGTERPSASYSSVTGNMPCRMDERWPVSADRLSVGLDGEIDPLTWAKFEVPAGPYKLIHMKGLSSFLPRYSDYGMLPPVVSMEDAGSLLAIAGEHVIWSSLKSWGPSGSGPAHKRPHVLDGLSGDPEEALQVCRKLVSMQRIRWKDPEDVTDLAIESIARWWLFLLVGRMRPGQIDFLWPDGFFHGVQGHDPICKDNAYFKLVRCNGGRIGAAFNRD